MLLDESGDHNLKKINPSYPIFVLGGVIVDRAYVRDVIEPAMREFKLRYFGRDDVILHTVDMAHGGGDYAFLNDAATRSSFYFDLNYSLHLLVERFCKALGEELDGGVVCVEKRNRQLDGELMEAWETLRTQGTRYASGEWIDRRIVGLDLRDKKPNLVGLQLADFVVTPIGRFVAGKPAKASQVQWSVVETKLRRVGDRYMGRGLVIRP